MIKFHPVRSRGFSPVQLSKLREMVKDLLEETEESGHTIDEGIKLLEDTMQYDMFVNCLELKDDSTGVSLERAILYSLIKCSTTNPIDQLMIALKFGGIDGIKEKILDEGIDEFQSSVDYGMYLCIKF